MADESDNVNVEVEATVEGGFLIVKVPLNDPPKESSSGKSLVIASSYGNKKTNLKVLGRVVTIGVSAYISKK